MDLAPIQRNIVVSQQTLLIFQCRIRKRVDLLLRHAVFPQRFTRDKLIQNLLAVAKVSAGALNYTPVARVTNLSRTIDELKDKGMWFVCGDMGGELMYDLNLTGSIGLIIGNEGNGVSRLVKEKCDYIASIPMKGDIDSLNASVATGVLAFEIVRQRMGK